MKLQYLYAKFLKKLRGTAIRDSRIHQDAKVEAGSSVFRSSFDRHTFCGYDCTIINTEVGPFTSIGARVTVGGATHPVHFVSTSPVFLSHRDSVRTKLARHKYLPEIVTRIGADVWICDGAYIKAGVTIGTGAVVGMGAVVTHDVEPYAIVAGNPARLIRKRFSHDVCDALQASRWWEMPDADLSKLGQLTNQPLAFLATLTGKSNS